MPLFPAIDIVITVPPEMRQFLGDVLSLVFKIGGWAVILYECGRLLPRLKRGIVSFRRDVFETDGPPSEALPRSTPVTPYPLARGCPHGGNQYFHISSALIPCPSCYPWSGSPPSLTEGLDPSNGDRSEILRGIEVRRSRDTLDALDSFLSEDGLGLLVENCRGASLLSLDVVCDVPVFRSPVLRRATRKAKLARMAAWELVEIPFDLDALWRMCAESRNFDERQVVLSMTVSYWDEFDSVRRSPAPFVLLLDTTLILHDEGTTDAA